MPKPKTIDAWSWSRWQKYAQCPRQAKYLAIDKMKQPPSDALERGKRVHTDCEKYVLGTGPLTDEMDGFAEEFKELLELRKTDPDRILIEQGWAFTKDFREQTGWFQKGAKAAWCRSKCDLVELQPEQNTVRIVDYKTGRNRGDNKRQLGLYALSAFVRYPWAEAVATEFWFLDENDLVDPDPWLRDEDYHDLLEVWRGRGEAITTDTEFRTFPGSHCRWCVGSPHNGGGCEASTAK